MTDPIKTARDEAVEAVARALSETEGQQTEYWLKEAAALVDQIAPLLVADAIKAERKRVQANEAHNFHYPLSGAC